MHLRRLIVVAAVGALAAVCAAVALASTGDPVASGHPRLTLVRTQPLTVAGRQFRPHARVRVTLAAGSSTSRQTTADRHGEFTVGFAVAVDRCTGWTVTATPRGAAPVRLRGPRPMCAPAATP